MDKNFQVLILLVVAAMGDAQNNHLKATPDGGGKITARNFTIDIAIVPREEWAAKPATEQTTMDNPVPFVIIHHSYIPQECSTEAACETAMRTMQTMHQETNHWADIGYNFAIGGDGRVYMGRGWRTVGAHAPTYNDKSIGICLIGDWRNERPPPGMLDAARSLLATGTRQGHIGDDYLLFGHRQVRAGTECPGDALFDEIRTWPHFGETPPHRYDPASDTDTSPNVPNEQSN